MQKVKFVKLNSDAIVPSYGSLAAAGADLYACLDEEKTTFEAGETKLIHTGIALEIPDGLVGLIYARSGIATKRSLAPANKVGVIDSDYRGEIMVSLHNHSNSRQEISNKERIAQIVFAPYVAVEFEETDSLSDTDRGVGGFGSTGKK